jgi:hypothetical protein
MLVLPFFFSLTIQKLKSLFGSHKNLNLARGGRPKQAKRPIVQQRSNRNSQQATSNNTNEKGRIEGKQGLLSHVVSNINIL